MSSPTIPPSVLMRPKVFPDLAVQAQWLQPLLWPCALLKHGAPGLLLIEWADDAGELHSATYAVVCVGRGWLKREGRADVDGYRILSPEGETYDIDPAGNGNLPSCDCGDATHRPRRGGCKHVAGLRAVGELAALAAQVNTFDGTGIDNP